MSSDPRDCPGARHARDRDAGADLAPADNPNAVRTAIADSVSELSRSTDATHIVAKALALIGAATGVSRIRIYNSASLNKPAQRYEWHAAKSAAPPEDAVRMADQKPPLVIPVLSNGDPWGEMEVDNGRAECAWSRLDNEVYTILAAIVGAALARERDIGELADAARIIENSATILFRFGAKKPYPIRYVSRNISRYGYRVADMRANPVRYLELIHPDDRPKAIDDVVRIGDGRLAEATRDIRLMAADGHFVWFECRITPVRGKDNRVTEIEGIGIDIDRRKTTESYISRFSRTDQLTALANRNGFIDALRQTFATAKRGAKPFAILYIDLDRFKDVNDVLGHSKGDELIKLVARRLKDAVRANDVIARFGGDEFAVLQTDLSDPSDAGALAIRILHDLSNPPYDIGTQVDITASIGISFFAPDTRDPEDMLKQADVALYRAKDSGRNQFHFHSDALDVAIIERVTLAGDLRRAVERHEIELYYQPQVEVRTGRIAGVEALARWHHPTQGMLWPGRFIPVAEQTDTIVPLGRWIIDDACRQIAVWRAKHLQPERVAINVSALQIKAAPGFDRELMECLERWAIPPDAVEIELTESVLMETTQEHRDIISRLRALGIAIAIDDFGTGYSSLSYLRAYSVSHIKIAQEFIQHLKPNSGDVEIVRAAIGLGHALGIQVIAEGVETEFQLGLLTEAGCELIQGYYYSPPVTAAQMTDLLRTGILRPADAPDRLGGQ